METDKIERITPEEFEAIHPIKGISQLALAVRDIQAGEAVKTQCRWNHTGVSRSCAGASLAHRVAKETGIKVATHCKNGTLYVMRIA